MYSRVCVKSYARISTWSVIHASRFCLQLPPLPIRKGFYRTIARLQSFSAPGVHVLSVLAWPCRADLPYSSPISHRMSAAADLYRVHRKRCLSLLASYLRRLYAQNGIANRAFDSDLGKRMHGRVRSVVYKMELFKSASG